MASLTLAAAVFCGVIEFALLIAGYFNLTGYDPEDYARWQSRIAEASLEGPRAKRGAVYEMTDEMSSMSRMGDRWRYKPEVRRIFYVAVASIAAAVALGVLREWLYTATKTPNHALQRTAGGAAFHLLAVCHRPFHSVVSRSGPAVAELVSR